jgi:hypothetical protein
MTKAQERFTVAQRREEVASLRLQGRTIREISRALVDKGITGQTGKPVSIGTVHRDLTILEAEWRAAAAQNTKDRQAFFLAQLDELKKQAWAKEDYKVVLQAMGQEARILGLEAPGLIKFQTDYGEFKGIVLEAVNRLPQDAREVFIAALKAHGEELDVDQETRH